MNDLFKCRRRNRRYGAIVCNLERRRIVTLFPDREVATVRAWLADHPDISVVSRDRGGGYGEASAKAFPDAMQVADCWHLMKNASAAFLDAVRKSIRAIRSAIGSTTITPELHLGRKTTTRAVCGADEDKLDAWIANANASLVPSFATGVLKDIAAVRAASRTLVQRPSRRTDYEF